MNQTLSIAIPTYKRATCLAQTLDAFIDQVRPYDVPICVSYNDDTDATEKVIAKAREKYPYIVATSNSAVTGIDRNICSALALATSRYAWLFGDDDIPKPGAVETLLSHLHQGDYGMVVVNGATFNNNFSRLVEPQRVRASADRIYLPGEHERLLAETASYITFLGGLVVRKDLWDSVSATPFLESDYVHVAVAYRYIVGHRALLIAKPLINIRLGGATWASRYFEVEMCHWPQTVWGLPSQNYSESSKAAVCARTPAASIPRLLATRAYGHYGFDEFRRYIVTDPAIPRWKKRFLKAILLVPQSLARRLLILYRRWQRLWGDPNWELTLYRLGVLT